MLRPVKDGVISPVAGAVCNWVHPTTVTLSAFVLSLGAFVCLLYEELFLCATLWLLGRLLDGLDGAVARRSGKQSDLGGYLDILLDVIAYALIPLGMVITYPADGVNIATATLLAVFYVNIASWMYLSAIVEKRRAGGVSDEATTVFMPAGLIEGTETIVFYTLFIAFPAAFVALAYAMAAMTGITVIQRLLWAIKVLPADKRT